MFLDGEKKYSRSLTLRSKFFDVPRTNLAGSGSSCSLGNVNIAKIYERLLSMNTLRDKRRDSSDPNRVNLSGEDSICMVNLLVILQKIVFFLLHD